MDTRRTVTYRLLLGLGYLLGLPLALALYHATGQNEYFLFPEVGRVLFLAVIGAGLILRLRLRRPVHTLVFAIAFAILFNWVLVVGGLLFLGLWSIPVVLGLGFASFFLLRKAPIPYRLAAWIILVGLVGFAALHFEREASKDSCAKTINEIDPVFSVLDDRPNAYDFALVEGEPRKLAATYGLDKWLVYYDLTSQKRPKKHRLPWTGVQRLTLDPDRRKLWVAAWGHWGEGEVLGRVDPTRREIVDLYRSPGCRNAFEVAVDDRKARFYLLCEASHNILMYEPRRKDPIATLELPGLDSYDLMMSRDGSRLYVSDWLSPYLSVVDAETLTLITRVRIGWTAFGVAEGADGTIYVARPLASEVVAIHPDDLSVTARIDVGFGARDMEVDLKRGILFVGNYFDGTVDLIDMATGNRVARKFVGKLLRGLLYDPKDDRLYLATGCAVVSAKVADLIGDAGNQ
jgi:YVTN family beta-propeller protein